MPSNWTWQDSIQRLTWNSTACFIILSLLIPLGVDNVVSAVSWSGLELKSSNSYGWFQEQVKPITQQLQLFLAIDSSFRFTSCNKIYLNISSRGWFTIYRLELVTLSAAKLTLLLVVLEACDSEWEFFPTGCDSCCCDDLGLVVSGCPCLRIRVTSVTSCNRFRLW